ncbi:MAG: HAMP domain-containing histidine kinase [Patescibacteria group bacterium]|nr:HAMP domain-containing histidine kinase [Patescibacteria group bacterium]
MIKALKDTRAGGVLPTEEKLKTDFVTLSSHQLRTPLSAIKWFIEILLTQRAGKLNKKQIDYIKEIQRSNERAIALVNDLLQVSRVQEGKLHLDTAEADLAQLVEEAVDAHRSLMTNNNISFHLEIINGPLPIIVVDRVKIRRVISNLLNNAVKYTPRGGSVRVVVKKEPRELVCSFSDTGVGIPVDEQEQLFQRFFRGSNVSKIQPDGTGLGLYIAKSLVEAHKGKIWFESEEGKGTTFYLSLPTTRK